MISMIVWRELGIGCVMALEHTGRMGHSDQKHRVFAGFAGRVLDRLTWMLFQYVIDVLYAGEVAFLYATNAFIEPADSRTQRHTIVTDFSGLLQFIQRFPGLIVIDLFHADIVKLQQID